MVCKKLEKPVQESMQIAELISLQNTNGWVKQDKFGSVLKGREEGGQVVGDHFFYREIFALYLNRVKVC